MHTTQTMAILTQLVLYPIKSCAGMAVHEAVVTPSGMVALGMHDREWMLVDLDNQFLTQRELPRMATIVPRVEDGELVLTAPGMAALRLALTQSGSSTRRVQIWDDAVDADDAGEGAAAWFSAALGRRCRLVRFRPELARPTSLTWTAGTPAYAQFADAYPYLLIGASALAEINAHLEAAGRAPLAMDRFRPNLVLTDTDPFEEDYSAALHCGEITLRPVKPCARCPIPAVDQHTGIPGPDPLDVLAGWRAKAVLDGAICVGMNCILESGAGKVLRLGDVIEVDLAF